MLKLQSRCLQRLVRGYAQDSHVAFQRGGNLMTLAIETSCDDTSVAILEAFPKTSECLTDTFSIHAHLHFHKKVTANNSEFQGINPLVAIESHQKNLATLVDESIQHLPNRSSCSPQSSKTKPDFVTVTRGPGMRSALTVGLDTAKGLAVAWQIPLLAVNHMQAHALTPRLVSALNTPAQPSSIEHESEISKSWEPTPTFPFLSLLVSGGHTLLVHTRSATDHAILVSTVDIAIGDCIDKMARKILPPSILLSTKDTMYGRLLERFAFPNGATDHPKASSGQPSPAQQERSFDLPKPMWDKGRTRSTQLSFSGLETFVRRICDTQPSMLLPDRRTLARESMLTAFEHLAQRTVWALQDLVSQQPPSSSRSRLPLDSDPPAGQPAKRIKTLVLSGGVASNAYLRAIMREWLSRHGFADVKIEAPPVELCTDNAAMIAWCGVEMWRAGWESGLGVLAKKKWSLDSGGEEGGILGVEGWRRRDGC